MAQTQRILCCDNIRDHSGLHFDRFFMDHPLRFSRYNVRVSGADLVVLAHFRREKVHLWNLSSPSIWGLAVLFSLDSEDVDNCALGWSKSFSPGQTSMLVRAPLDFLDIMIIRLKSTILTGSKPFLAPFRPFFGLLEADIHSANLPLVIYYPSGVRHIRWDLSRNSLE